MNTKERQKQWKKDQRKLNTAYAQRQREAKRSSKVKAKRRIARQDPAKKEKERLYQIEYRKRPEVIKKNKARNAANQALINGILKRPENCELCGAKDIPLRGGRTGLRMDHYLGYEKVNWLKVKFICVACDGKQLRGNYD
jgi:hypothetical protein